MPMLFSNKPQNINTGDFLKITILQKDTREYQDEHFEIGDTFYLEVVKKIHNEWDEIYQYQLNFGPLGFDCIHNEWNNVDGNVLADLYSSGPDDPSVHWDWMWGYFQIEIKWEIIKKSNDLVILKVPQHIFWYIQDPKKY